MIKKKNYYSSALMDTLVFLLCSLRERDVNDTVNDACIRGRGIVILQNITLGHF